MSFVAENLNIIAYANGFTLWNYIGNDSIDEICKKNYFVEANEELKNGDMIIFSGNNISCSSGAILLIIKDKNSDIVAKTLCSFAEKQ